MSGTKPRQSNFELLRLLSMVMVLGLHANFKAIGLPTIEDSYLHQFSRVFWECLCIVCVNVFVLISGWFGIKSSTDKLKTFLFQCFFNLAFVYLIYCIIGEAELDVKGILSCFCAVGNGWFVICYLGLFLLSPMLNKFIESSSRKSLAYSLIIFWSYIFLWGWLIGDNNFNQGYSTIVFIGLYLIGRFLKLYRFNIAWSGIAFFACSLLNTMISMFLINYCNSIGVGRIVSYISPVVIIQSVLLLLWFSKINIGINKVINWLSISAFGVYLVQDVSPYNEKLYNYLASTIYNDYNGFSYIGLIIGLITVFFCSGIFLDKIRLYVWSRIFKLRKG